MAPRFNAHFIIHLFKHYWNATRIDVLHSPFVFSLYNNCIARQKKDKDLLPIEMLRRKLKGDTALVMQEDFGAGDAEPVKQKSISEFASLHAKSARVAEIIHRIVYHYKHRNVIELGTSLGLTSSYIASALRKQYPAGQVKFCTIEGAPEIARVAQINFETLGLDEFVTLLTGNFDNTLPELLPSYPHIDLAFIDGNHRYEPTIDYFSKMLPRVHNNSMLVFDDIYWSADMTKAWEEIKKHPRVTVTVDLFFIGIVMFRREQARQHFKLRVW